ncbi:aromatic ring-hydroxylating dioxygenase subunit alpha [Spirulina sp. CS-785/01]|uniref:aromatic ring-hydroxylating oxygenase subunit alpha n=1 Tax=Spirulina sp. CS-785/01 TaxID=3021716 RepID=UPI00232C6259|nr:aromatic ring-hydroxylating dioxygenase subunit alpha [Spirulina sp. CS-785/01]MDB9313964.1 aromatic ring-hydroxylating dioxygenase subunit alpha [Spirulina sp. CS-785/01]
MNNKIFNNWDVIAKGWYIACPSRDIPKGKAKSLQICGQQIVFFRGEDGKIRALDAFCPHLGTDLGIGKVEQNQIRCFFHHWRFDETGNCTNIPCQETIPKKAKLQSYATDEKYGFIWVYPDAVAESGVAEFDELNGKDYMALADQPLTRNCHHHICMMNGIDAQHLRTVHKINISMELLLEENETGNIIDFTLRGEFPSTTLREKLGQKLLGKSYEYTMRYADGCLGLLTIMKNVKFFPPLHMIYAYTPVDGKYTRIQPIYVTEKRRGVLGWVTARFLLLCTRLAYYLLRGEDGQIYDNIRFNPNAILEIDTPLVKYMNYVDTLEVSKWSIKTLG